MRDLEPHVRADLTKKRVFVGGPRQCGKATMARAILADDPAGGVYLNWDVRAHRRIILEDRWQEDDALVVLDEGHKRPRWKTWIKGLFDTRPAHRRYLVTGSARLDVYRRGGDSLLGRYHYWRLHPFCLGELPRGLTAAEGLRRLMAVGGFPEPFLDGDARAARRWRRERLERVMRDDLRSLEPVRDIGSLELLIELLRRRVGGLVVLANLARELEVAPKTVKHWLGVLERMYLIFVVRPWAAGVSRSLAKPCKVYFYDTQDVLGDAGGRFENLVATHLLKRLQLGEDYDGYGHALHYVRDKEGREVDFAVSKEGALDLLVEAKWADGSEARPLAYFAERLRPRRAPQVVGELRRSYDSGRLRVAPATEVFATLALP